RAGNPRARAAAQVSLARLPRVVAFLARACSGIAPPELLAGRGIPAVEETARAEFGAGAAGDQDSVRDQRCNGERVAFLPLGHFLLPQLLAGLLVERHPVRVERGAEHLALEDRDALVRHAAAHDAWRSGVVIDRRAPDHLARERIDRVGPAR